jgi:hypothetical protein|tara:strand:- start:6147 stop:6350 length:204 start_codon:yes stop_codon:yes gene_type:complete
MEFNNIYIAIIGWTSIMVTILTGLLLYTNWKILNITKSIHNQARETRKEIQKANIINKDIKRFIGGR